MPFSDRARWWKVLAALALLCAGGIYNNQASRRELPIWHENLPEGQPFWLIGQDITAVDPAGRWLDARMKGYRVHILAAPGTMPDGASPGRKLYAVVRHRRGIGFALEAGARTSPHDAYLVLVLASLPAVAFVAWAFLKRFRPSLSASVSERADA